MLQKKHAICSLIQQHQHQRRPHQLIALQWLKLIVSLQQDVLGSTKPVLISQDVHHSNFPLSKNVKQYQSFVYLMVFTVFQLINVILTKWKSHVRKQIRIHYVIGMKQQKFVWMLMFVKNCQKPSQQISNAERR